MKKVILVILIFTAVLFSGCTSLGGRAKIDWVDFICFNGISYERISSDTVPDASSIDKEYARVGYKVEGNTSNPNYKTKDGDAAFFGQGYPGVFAKGI